MPKYMPKPREKKLQGAALLRAAVVEMVSAGEGDGGAAGGGVACEKRIVVPQV
jgi:hypothetical protein